ncbi:anaerobic ribonucleoside-triphosphate reductase activating protein [Veillonella criceti]|uniref:Anaerobic ribonucleoside-triphosphate reductase-activating protein n=1 Tax=Veillonella criceti TaxID=103891 RepID=A0A380NHQ3_9FIRM|nr:anaerobic ribonucleoside-triphosphate reductase activating protein [Veillonella criceti]SUP39667.1 anaerobic ribonucleotide reductase-activating protein [Veillonella criceti]
MNYGQIRKYDIANGNGIRTSIFVTGCTHKCFNCFNEEYQNPKAGSIWTETETQQVIDYVSDPNVTGLTLLGGEPFQNVEGLLPVVIKVREKVPNKDIWAYSGYTWDEIVACPSKRSLLEQCDILVDGKFVDALRDPSLRFRGSKNQRIIDVKQSLATGHVVIAME